MDIITIQIYWTVVAFVLFVGIIFWAYSNKQKPDFDYAANSLLDDDDGIVLTTTEAEKKVEKNV